MQELPTMFQQFIAKSRYARWMPKLGRRENWPETVARYFDFFTEHLHEKHGYVLTKELRDELEDAVLNLRVMPSMRALMTAGPALKRDNIAGFNCSYLPIDHLRAFDEVMYILMNGTGVGFSVEREYVERLPQVNEHFENSSTVIVVDDSKQGWAKAFRELIALLYQGQVPKWDTSHLRAAGEKLKVFGGRSSGPKPLEALFSFTVNLIKGAAGRRLSSLECHDLVCKTAGSIVVGGVRRSALISLSDLSDSRMRDAKSHNWWIHNEQRALANNSVAYTCKPDMLAFMKEWTSLVESGSGERGIYNRQSATKQAAKFGRRDKDHAFGLNPCCVTGYTNVLTDQGEKPIKELIGKEVNVWNGLEWSTVTPFETGRHPTVIVEVSNGKSLQCTLNHKFIIFTGDRVLAADLSVGDVLKNFDANSEEVLYVKSITPAGVEDTYCFDEPKNHTGTFNGIVTGQSEIILRPYQFCNLSEAVVRAGDDEEALLKKIRIATILGTFQSTLTDFKYLRKVWQRNTEEERLLGVSMTGIMDHATLAWDCKLLAKLRDYAVEVNKEYAAAIGIPQSTATTCVKPSGTVSKLVDSASGLHARYARYYIQTIRGDVKDPITMFMKSAGIPWEPSVSDNTGNTAVFSFAIKSPESAKTRHDLTAIEQLEVWLNLQRHFSEHKPSCTCFVKPNEWMAVGSWIWEHFDEVSGISFLPTSEHTYQQAPWQDCSEQEYLELEAKMPKRIDWDEGLSNFEFDDQTEGSQELACTGNSCEIIDISKK